MKDKTKPNAPARKRLELTRREALMATAGFAAFAATGSAFAQSYPARPVEIICPFGAGGGTDQLARALADGLSKDLGQPFQVVNRTGGSGAVGFEALANADPDGYTLCILTAQLITHNLRDVLKLSYKDFEPISMVSVDYAAFAVRADSPIKTFDEFIAKAKSEPGAMTLGNGGDGGSFHMLARDLEEQAGIEFKHVPFDGGPAAILQLLGGHIDATVNGPTELLPYVESGDFRLLAVGGDKRREDFPDVPTTAELGHPLNISTWRGLGAPGGTPAEIVSTVDAAISRVVETDDFKATMVKIGSNIDYMDSEKFVDFLSKQEDAYGKIFS